MSEAAAELTDCNLSADIFSDASGKKWTAVLKKHPAHGGNGVEAWRRSGMRSEHNAELAMEAAWGRIVRVALAAEPQEK